MQPGRDRPPDDLDPQTSIRVEQVAAVEDSQPTDLLRPSLIRPQHELIFCGQPLHQPHPRLSCKRQGG
jgi:hypothetical protein